MKPKYTLTLLFSFLFLSTTVLAQNKITIELAEFTSLSVSGRIDVELIPSDSKEMSITSKIGQPEVVSVEVKNDELSLKIRPKFKSDEVISIQLPYKTLSKIESLAGAVVNSARDLTAESVELSASSGGKIELSVTVNTIDAKITQISDIILYGTAETQNVTVNTGGNYLAYDLDCKDTFVKVSSGSQAKVTASRTIEANANSKGFIGVIGDPDNSKIKTSLGGEISSYKTRPEDMDN